MTGARAPAADKPCLVLIARLDSCACAIALTNVIETMRPLPVNSIAGMPAFVQGLALIRGQATPVVDLGLMLGKPASVSTRFVTLRTGNRQVALAVGDVLDIRPLDAALLPELPPLLHGAPDDAIAAVSRLDDQLLLVLRDGWMLPDAIWQSLRSAGGV